MAEWVSDRVNRREGAEIVHAKPFVLAAMEGDGAAEAIGLFVHRLIALMPGMRLGDSRRMQNRAAHAELRDGPS